jgi:hypothetical protein
LEQIKSRHRIAGYIPFPERPYRQVQAHGVSAAVSQVFLKHAFDRRLWPKHRHNFLGSQSHNLSYQFVAVVESFINGRSGGSRLPCHGSQRDGFFSSAVQQAQASGCNFLFQNGIGFSRHDKHHGERHHVSIDIVCLTM